MNVSGRVYSKIGMPVKEIPCILRSGAVITRTLIRWITLSKHACDYLNVQGMIPVRPTHLEILYWSSAFILDQVSAVGEPCGICPQACTWPDTNMVVLY